MQLGDAYLSATELASLVRRRQVLPSELVGFYLDRIARLNPGLNAFCHLAAEEALEEALRYDGLLRTRSPLPPFFGVPIGIKDLHPVRGWPLCSASNATTHPPALADGAAVRALRQAGFIFLGSTTSPEIGVVAVTESSRHGATSNPWSLGRSPGGSSGGAAASVAAGMLPVAHGSDGAGSIRCPASYCGLVGLKPSRGRVPAETLGFEGLVSEGVLTHSVEDTGAVLDVFDAALKSTWYAAPTPLCSYRRCTREAPRRLRIGLNLQPAFPASIHPDALAVVEAAADALDVLGHEVTPVEIPGLEPEWMRRVFEVIWVTASAGLTIPDDSRLEPLNRVMRERARANDSMTYVEAVYELQLRSAEMSRAWEDVDVMLTPTNPVPAPPLGSIWEGQEEDPWRPLRRAEETAAFTVLSNVLGLPAISLPLATPSDGVPLGVQLVGRLWDDATVLALSGELERTRPWRARRPRVPSSSASGLTSHSK